MAITVRPRGRLEDDVIKRLLGYIPEGDFYLRAQYELPKSGTGFSSFIIRGVRGRTVQVKLNGELVTRIGMVASEESIRLRLLPPPSTNDVTVIDEIDQSTDSISVVTTNYATIHTGAARDYFSHVYLPYQYQDWSLRSQWTARPVEYLFKYHNRFPDTQAMRVLAARLNSHAVWNDGVSSQGIRSQIAALTASMPVVQSVTNQRESVVGSFNVGMVPLVPPQADYNGWELNVWFPDLGYAREVAFMRWINNLQDFYHLKDYQEDNTQLYWQDTYIPIHQQQDGGNLRQVFDLIGCTDYWQGFAGLTVSEEIFQRYYGFGPDLLVFKTLGGGNYWDAGYLLDQGLTWDTNDAFSEKWDLLDVIPADVGETLDSTVKRAVCSGETRVDNPFASEWEWTDLVCGATTATTIPNTLHGGAAPEFVA